MQENLPQLSWNIEGRQEQKIKSSEAKIMGLSVIIMHCIHALVGQQRGTYSYAEIMQSDNEPDSCLNFWVH